MVQSESAYQAASRVVSTIGDLLLDAVDLGTRCGRGRWERLKRKRRNETMRINPNSMPDMLASLDQRNWRSGRLPSRSLREAA